jgi:hypothetical protein
MCQLRPLLKTAGRRELSRRRGGRVRFGIFGQFGPLLSWIWKQSTLALPTSALACRSETDKKSTANVLIRDMVTALTSPLCYEELEGQVLTFNLIRKPPALLVRIGKALPFPALSSSLYRSRRRLEGHSVANPDELAVCRFGPLWSSRCLLTTGPVPV